jgi:hypothetical protein
MKPVLCLRDISTHAPSGWLEKLAEFMPETVKVEVSSYALIAVLVALWIWRHPRKGGGEGG